VTRKHRWWLLQGVLCVSSTLLSAVPVTAGPEPARTAANASTLRVGTLTLKPCKTPGAWCGAFSRAMDPTGAVPGTVPIYFEYYRHLDGGPSAGTLVATEGGPGYPATETRAGYLALYQPLRGQRDVLIMDNRGTGGSGAVDCPTLQRQPVLTEASVAACGTLLGTRAPLYSTTLATDDLAALIDALALGRVDLYGDSYGTFFAQVFAVRHPDRLRSLVLDGAYPLGDAGYAWYPAYAPAMRDKFNLACQRSPACSALPGDSMSHIAPALRLLREKPFAAAAQDLSGKLQRFVADAGQLATAMFGSAPALATVRELDAAARAFAAGDRLPLLRLMAESQVGTSGTAASPPPGRFSAGLAAAVMCQDAPQVFDMSLPPVQRRADRDRALAAREAQAPETYAPFTFAEYRRMPLDYSFIDECVAWPAPPASHPAGRLTDGPLQYPPVPTLVVSGDLDNMTPIADGAVAAANFPHGRQVVIRNGFHVNALPHARADCGAIVVRQFIAGLAEGDTRCVQAVPAVRLLPQFARQVAELEPAVAGTGNAAGRGALQAVAAALLTAGDAMARAPEIAPGRGVGLRGGRFSVSRTATGYRLKLRGLRWTEDLTVSGSVEWPPRAGPAQATLDLAGVAGMKGRIEARWIEGQPLSTAQVRGQVGGQGVVAELTAP
jgi:pimeloyl-ACP methyl ester carboxylesterase